MLLESKTLLHDADAKTWQPLGDLFQVEQGVVGIDFSLAQAADPKDPPDGTRAAFDDLEILLFEDESAAVEYRKRYVEEHPKEFENTK